ncbi:hypothetical protein [Alteromonas sp. a30]|uniref:hypothetical protein n=1 Tax=Alteromonas sp. a30 TaxID=2730917 RepID=UPI00227E5DA0|nr:hypothetical protein [Alteromonas sp. a30]MCY7294909.1 hypothetical protein [Alteromonas sp. a30]
MNAFLTLFFISFILIYLGYVSEYFGGKQVLPLFSIAVFAMLCIFASVNDAEDALRDNELINFIIFTVLIYGIPTLFSSFVIRFSGKTSSIASLR